MTLCFKRTFIRSVSIGLAAYVLFVLLVVAACAVTVTTKSGDQLTGNLGKVDHVAEDPNNPAPPSGPVDLQRIVIIDNGLRRVFVSQRQIASINDAANQHLERIRIRQDVASAGGVIGSIGPIIRITPFDKYGRRTFTMSTGDGQLSVVQGITQITPVHTTVEGLKVGGVGNRAIVWKSKLATSSLSRATLGAILGHALDQADSDDRLAAVRLYIESERFEDAAAELNRIKNEFPDLDGLDAQLTALRQQSARRLLREIQFRSTSGQHRMVYELLSKFPAEGVAGETLQHVRELVEGYDTQKKRRAAVLEKFDELAAESSGPRGERLQRIRDELEDQLSFNTLSRMAAFERLAGDEKLTPEQRLAIAVSGWLLGTDDAVDNLAVALSLVEVRDEVRAYITEPVAARRTEILSRLRSLEGASVANIAELCSHMRPPLEPPAADDGFYELSVTSRTDDPDIRYLVQTPPEYDPLKLYPAVVTLNGAGSTAEHQIDWWAGGRDDTGSRRGQGTRRGYITIAVDWQKSHQSKYEYSGREHNAVLRSLRQACRQFAINTNLVYLSGHSMGGDAAWDIGLAHPDLWAGVIPIVAVADRYVARYWPNARYVPTYFVAGDLDGGKMARNARDLDRYLHNGFDATVAEYLGRGHEHFHEDVQNIFDWMSNRRRDFFRRKFECHTMRPWDNYFWWLEVSELPERTTVYPEDWPQKNRNPMRISGEIHKTGTISVRSGAAETTVWLSPELVDFNEPVEIRMIGRSRARSRKLIEPSLEVLLEDIRSRGDRQHPFWAKVVL